VLSIHPTSELYPQSKFLFLIEHLALGTLLQQTEYDHHQLKKILKFIVNPNYTNIRMHTIFGDIFNERYARPLHWIV
jgi:hypothetical protein